MSSSKFDLIIAGIISDSPSCEIREVYNDLIAIAGENAKESILEAIEQYNIDNTIPIEVDGEPTIVSKYNKEGSKFFDPVRSKLFSVDPLNRVGLDIESSEAKLNSTQEKIYQDLKEYTSNDFSGDVVYAVYPVNGEDSKTAIFITSTKYNPSNFWNGTWRSQYIYDSSSNSLEGSIDVKVHYYEEGNVSFKSNKEIYLLGVSAVTESLREVENAFENELDVSFEELNEKQFRDLRRRLPITRSKVNWGKSIGVYRLGKDAAQSGL